MLQRHTVNDSWALATYDACRMRCSYCITRAQGTSEPRFPPAEIRTRLAAELDAIPRPRQIGVGTYADAFPDVEADLAVTRAALEVFDEHEQSFNLVTKGLTVLRDIDLFHRPHTFIQLSVCTLDHEFVVAEEPGVAPPEDRIAAANHLAERGVNTVIQCAPWIPDVTDVGAIRRLAHPSVVIQVTPLRLPDYLERARRRFRFEQHEINAAYRQAYERGRDLPAVRWSRPPALDGAPPHITDNFGSRQPVDWTPAPSAPDPGHPALSPDGTSVRVRRRFTADGGMSSEVEPTALPDPRA